MPSPIRIGISACLLGEEVRFDGGHKRDQFLTTILAPHVEFVPVCPEVEMGLGTPRETLRLVRAAGSLRMMTTRTGIDHSEGMNRWAAKRLTALEKEDLSGYVLKKDSPSCGMDRVRVYRPGGATRDGRGLFAEALASALPNLPIEEEGRLHDPVLRENFVERVFAYARVRAFFAGRWSRGGLVRFHTAHKLQLLAHARAGYGELGRLVADVAGRGTGEMADQYERTFMRTLTRLATPGRHADVMTHMVGHLKRLIDAPDRDELLASIDDHRRGLVPLIVPITLIRHHVRRHHVEYLLGQTYLDPHPRELALRNHV